VPPKTQKILDELKAYCDAERGRRTEVAEKIGISRQALANWFYGRQQPTSEQILTVQEFLRQQQK
jgi:hypothetical protein